MSEDDHANNPDFDSETGKWKAGKHPNSVKAFQENRADTWTTETATEIGRRGGEVMKARAEKRKRIREKADELTMLNDELKKCDFNAVDMLRLQMAEAHMQEDDDRVFEIAKVLAEFDAPKLARIETKIEEVSTDEMTKEEILERIKRITAQGPKDD